MNSQKGFTLVELMVALVISLVVAAGAIQVFVMAKRSFNEIDSIADRQESLRFISEVVPSDIRTAGSVSIFVSGDDEFRSCGGGDPFDADDPEGFEELAVLVLQYDDLQDGRHPRSNDPYCSGGQLDEVRYIAYETSLDVCHVCDGVAGVGQNFQDEIAVTFSFVGADVYIGAGAVVEIGLEFLDGISFRGGRQDSLNMWVVRRGQVICSLSEELDC